jgi:hypothetical protein
MRTTTTITDASDCAGARRRPWPADGVWADRAGFAAPADRVRVFDAEPDLLAGLSAREVDVLRRRATAPKLWAEEGPWDPPEADSEVGRSFGLLVVEGFMVRCVELDGRHCPELVGPGDVLRPWEELEGSVAYGTTWTALERTSLAVFDQPFTSIVSRWPSIVVQLLARTVERSRSLAFHLAIAHVRHAELRLHLLFWHLADRWGRVTPHGVHLPLRLRHELLAQLACMRRPTASSAVSHLTRSGELAREPDGTWLLTGAPPTPLQS